MLCVTNILSNFFIIICLQPLFVSLFTSLRAICQMMNRVAQFYSDGSAKPCYSLASFTCDLFSLRPQVLKFRQKLDLGQLFILKTSHVLFKWTYTFWSTTRIFDSTFWTKSRVAHCYRPKYEFIITSPFPILIVYIVYIIGFLVATYKKSFCLS